jgi:CheY-like chemotaxis protein
MSVIVPYLEMYQAGLAPEGRPAGIFLLLGPTGTGKTRTVEALAEVLHGHAGKIVKINCGEYQLEHEVAKLIGAPPGFIGHRESTPFLTQSRLAGAASDLCDLTLVLFDEIEKAAPSLTRLLLGVLDRGVLQLGDNTSVHFERTFIFLTSNLGAQEMMKELNPSLGFTANMPREPGQVSSRLEAIALAGIRKIFSPEFVNRIDAVITYHPLDEQSLHAILDQHISGLQAHVNTRLGARCFQIEVSDASRKFLLQKGTSAEYGARQLKRVIHRHLTQPLASAVARAQIEPGSRVRVELAGDGASLHLKSSPGMASVPVAVTLRPTVLLVDDNHDLLGFLEQALAQEGYRLLTAESAGAARRLMEQQPPTAALLDYALPDGNGLELALLLRRQNPQMDIILMTGGAMSPEETELCAQFGFPLLRKPFLTADVTGLLRNRIPRVSAVRA